MPTKTFTTARSRTPGQPTRKPRPGIELYTAGSRYELEKGKGPKMDLVAGAIPSPKEETNNLAQFLAPYTLPKTRFCCIIGPGKAIRVHC
jgi:hypothetical protein